MRLSGLFAIVCCSYLAFGQEVHVTPIKNGVVLSVAARKYHILATEEKEPTLSIQCAAKGKKSAHILMFSSGSAITEDNAEIEPRSGEFMLSVTIGGTRQTTDWIPYGDTGGFAYYGKTEPERVKFIQYVLSSPSISIEFKPFLTGVPVTTTFDLGTLREEMDKHPECALP